ncbi:MAG TPA: oligosaccharide flippase family protein [Chitinophagaceae bacterium]|nr:oligosaccharide flippase family protein [Chitinophagaceae bacterium]
MSGIKKLAGQTLWYGGSTIFSRLLNYLLTPYLTLKLSWAEYGEFSLVYSVLPFLTVIFSYGMETAYFRFVQREEYKKSLNNTASVSIIVSTLVLTSLMILGNKSIASLISLKAHPEYITWAAFIIALDTLALIPLARLRQDGRPVKFAIIRVSSILVNIAVTYFLISLSPRLLAANSNSFVRLYYDKNLAVGYIIIANLMASGMTLLLLWKEFTSFRWQFDKVLWKEMIVYTLPLLVVGFGGVINETFDRIMLGWWSPAAGEVAKHAEVGTYSACYKLSILITLFIQAFRMGAEPFFFKQASGENPQKVYARVMKFFVITICVMFLVVALFLDIWKYFIKNEAMWAGLKVVPILLLANMFLGIYYNLSVWYKVTNKTMTGAYITLAGAAITLSINYFFIPLYSYTACAWATFLCYGSMMVMSFVLGQKYYYVPYAWKKLLAYMVIVVLLFFVHKGVTHLYSAYLFKIITGLLLLLAFVLFILKIEKREFQRLPFIGKYLR